MSLLLNWKRLVVVTTAGLLGLSARAADAPDGTEFFEKKIRPLLAEHCIECHAIGKKTKGGLALDSREGWMKGGDSGPALVPGDLETSRLITAVRYQDKEFRMPPKRKLTDAQIADFEQWVKLGAPDPRTGGTTLSKKEINIAEGRKHWAYQLPKAQTPPAVQDAAWPRTDVDRFLLAKLEAKSLHPSPDAEPAALARRLYFDLVGLPPTPEQVDAFVRDYQSATGNRQSAIAKLVDSLLASPHFGERWGRHWLDVVRYAESLTLRGFVMKEAWRYRDYVINSFNADKPYDRFLREQVAGDLLPNGSVAERQQQLVATGFLTLGNTNLEEQQKKLLDMDVVDEQLDTIGKAFLAQTIGCARCHDHKFDPIPTRDYYALAGILKSSKTLEHSNVSKWLEFPLPLPSGEDKQYVEHDKAVAKLTASIKTAKESANKAVAKKATLPSGALDAKVLAGVVVDDAQAKKVGDWTGSRSTKTFIGDGYLHDDNQGKGAKSLTFQPEGLKAGKYDVRLAYSPGKSRADNVPVTIFSAEGEKVVRVDERPDPPIEGRFVSLGQFRFEQNSAGFVLVATEGTKGVVTADAVQFVPVGQIAEPSGTADAAKKDKPDTTESVKKMEAELKKLQESGPKRPMFMSVKEDNAGDTQVHIRGSVQNLGAKVPRGFLQVASYGPAPVIPEKESGRRELGEWLTSRENPLTARVFVNRAWTWLFGTGLVRSPDNFGATGDVPTHPELLDHLAVRFMAEGWSVKKLVRELVLSRAYQQASVAADVRRLQPPQTSDPRPQTQASQSLLTSAATGQEIDPENKLFWHANRRKLDAEAIRDTVLQVSGQLDLAQGGPVLKPGTSADYGYKHTDSRRSVYSPVLRNSLPELFEAFDFADPSLVVGKRSDSTVAPQALFMMNHPWVMEQSQSAAKKLLAEPLADDRARIARAYRLVLGRLPTDGEVTIALKFLPADSAASEAAKRADAWGRFYQALFASVDFRYLN
ncbi:MAG: DUF1553 domain-containing protein [Proteobacteria bacterium]|nr:DUF1553 domain-containing protein [Pseudomonadota bacterium]